MKIFKLLFVSVISFLVLSINARANTINKISMDIYVDQNGDAHITEVWDATLNEGTEGYHPFYNLYNSTITDFRVKDEKGTVYTYIPNWDIKDSFEQKAYKNGFYKLHSEIDLCWGISEYGDKTYTLTYTIKNYIYNTTDGYQILFWQLIPHDMSPEIKDVYIKIHSDKAYDSNLEVWGYGNYGGTAYVYDGYIEMRPPVNGLKSSDYMTILVKFPANYFNTTNKIDQSWDQIFKTAEAGAKKNDNSSNKINNNNDSSNNSFNEILEEIEGNTKRALEVYNDNDYPIEVNDNGKEILYIIAITVLGSVLIAVLILLFVYKKKNN